MIIKPIILIHFQTLRPTARLSLISWLTALLLACGGSGSGTPNSVISTGTAPSGETESTNTGVNSDTNGGGDGEITLYWQPPTLYADGTSISTGEIYSYEIYWRNTESTLSNLTTISDPDTQEYTIGNLGAGEYQFSIIAKTIYGSQSDQSNIIKRLIN